ncbi:ABC transporter permease, partial [Enterocloster asparagiformis]|uniref:ABC transporter permease n=1 Tax=Enterocloster asparagiformis TaxID=333367 RepID=UPI0004B6D37B
MMIHSAFAVTMESRLQQLGIMKSVGAAPAQIRTVLLQEAMALCLFPVLAGIPLGAGSCYWFMRMAGSLAENLGVSRAVGAVFYFPAPVALLSLSVCLFTVWISARLPAGRLGRLTPLEAVRGGRESAPGKMRRFRLIAGLFGIEGELARKSLYARRRAFRTAGISLTLACFVFSAFLNFEVVSYLHTYHTFFERYKDTWDLLLTLDKRAEREGMAGYGLLEALRGLDGVERCAEYRKFQAHIRLPEDTVSGELEALGGPLGLTDTGIVRDGRDYLAQAPLVVLDDVSFQEYCRESGVELEPWVQPEAGVKLEPGDDLLTGGTGLPVVAVNRIWDNLNSRYKNRQYVPYLKAEAGMELELAPAPLKARILAYSDLPPNLREEYEDFALVLVAPESGFRNVEAAFEKADRHFNILTDSDQVIDGVQAQIEGMMGSAPGWEMENRLSEEAFNEAVRTGYKLVMGILCGILALVGLSNVFANALGSITQRKREFARYLSVGMTPGSVRRVLALEAFYVCAKPVAVSLLLNIPFVAYCLRASHLMPGEYLANIPVLPIGIFVLSIFLAVGTAYWIGGRRILRGDLVGMLRDGTQI